MGKMINEGDKMRLNLSFIGREKGVSNRKLNSFLRFFEIDYISEMSWLILVNCCYCCG